MNKRFFIVTAALMFAMSASAGTNPGGDDGDDNTKTIHRPRGVKRKNTDARPQLSYNSSSTVLNVSFPGNGQDGKIEIYRNGAEVLNTSAPVGASFSFMLCNYGKGDYTVIVSCGNTIVYGGSYNVK